MAANAAAAPQMAARAKIMATRESGHPVLTGSSGIASSRSVRVAVSTSVWANSLLSIRCRRNSRSGSTRSATSSALFVSATLIAGGTFGETGSSRSIIDGAVAGSVVTVAASLPDRSPGTRFSRAARIQSSRVTGREDSGDSIGISGDDFVGESGVTCAGSSAVILEGTLAVTGSDAAEAVVVGADTAGPASTSAGGTVAGANTRGVTGVVAAVCGAAGTGATNTGTTGGAGTSGIGSLSGGAAWTGTLGMAGSGESISASQARSVSRDSTDSSENDIPPDFPPASVQTIKA